MIWIILFSSLLLSSTSLQAASFDEQTFTPRAEIFKESSDGDLEIVADKTKFTAFYDNYSNTFKPINIPFLVRSKSGNNISYKLSLKLSQQVCDDGFEIENINDYSLSVNGAIFSFENSIPVSVDGSENDHLLTMTFTDEIKKKNTFQNCYGYIGIAAGPLEL